MSQLNLALPSSVTVDDWYNMYGQAWSDITPQAVSHPAKFSRKLIFRIYEHCAEQGWLGTGSAVLDPFAGVGLGALPAMLLGCNWIGVELEQKFVGIATGFKCNAVTDEHPAWCEQQIPHQPHWVTGNLELWQQRFAGKTKQWGAAQIIQGDSRRLMELLSMVDITVTSPPYSTIQLNHPPGTGHKQVVRRRERMKDAGYSAEKIRRELTPGRVIHGNLGHLEHYSDTPDNLANLPQGSIDTVISRGTAAGQLGGMLEGRVDAVITSPPYEDVAVTGARSFKKRDNNRPMAKDAVRGNIGYGNAPGQLSGQETFWSAARTIVSQVYAVTKPGGHAVWVLKNYVRDNEVVDFCNMWRVLCESVGFVTAHVHRAWLRQEYGGQLTMDGGEQAIVKEHKSFFRRQHESKGSPRIDYEWVLCMERPV